MAKITEATGGRMIDVAFDAVGITSTAEQAIKYRDTNGKMIAVGVSAQEMRVGSFLEMALRRKNVIGHLGYTVQDIAMLAELVACGRLDVMSRHVGLVRVM